MRGISLEAEPLNRRSRRALHRYDGVSKHVSMWELFLEGECSEPFRLHR